MPSVCIYLYDMRKTNNMLVFRLWFIVILFLVMGLYEENKDVYGLIIDNIKKYRKKRGLTQQGLSLRAHISKGYLSQIEAKNYNRFCSLDVLINIAQALEVPLYKLFLPPNVIFIDEAVSAELDLDKIQKALAAMEEQDDP